VRAQKSVSGLDCRNGKLVTVKRVTGSITPVSRLVEMCQFSG